MFKLTLLTDSSQTPVGAFVLHSVIAFLACVGGTVLGALLQPHAGLFSPIRQFAAVCVLAGFAGYCAKAWSESRAAFWIWIPPGLVLAQSLFFSERAWPSAWKQYFGPDCSSSECLYALFLTAPFLGAVTYSLAALIRARVRKEETTGRFV
jgi:hypothetical protein